MASSKRGKDKIRKAAVVGAIIELGLCLDLTSTAGVRQVRIAHQRLVEIHAVAELPLPENNPDGLRRNLDCAVVTALHGIRREANEPAIDTVKGVFIEGKPIYANAGFHEKTHVQICVSNPDRIKGVFRVPPRFLV